MAAGAIKSVGPRASKGPPLPAPSPPEEEREKRRWFKAHPTAAPVLDSYALLAYLRDEDTAETVQTLLEKASRKDAPLLMTEVNYAEVKYIVLRKDGRDAWNTVEASLGSLPIEFVPTSRSLADTAADFKANYRISLADAFAAALAKEKKSELVTGDREFEALEKEIKISWLK
jgi:predicted nucleic acid-binding protein